MEVDNVQEVDINLEMSEPNIEVRAVSPILQSRTNVSRRRSRRNLQDTSIISGHITADDLLVPSLGNTNPPSDNQFNETDRVADQVVSTQEENSTSNYPELDLDAKASKEEKCEKERRKRPLSDCEDDDGQICSICLDNWTNSGEHRLTALKCGHLFGHQCIQRWLRGDIKNRYCPTCKTKAHAKDMRFIFAKKIIVLDTSERDRLRDELAKVTSEKSRLELEYQVCLLNLKLQSKEILELKESNYMLSMNQHPSSSSQIGGASSKYPNSKSKPLYIYLEKNLEICSEKGCRVLSYNLHYKWLAISQKNNDGSMFPGYAVKLINMRNFRTVRTIYSGSEPIRDMKFNSINVDLLLIVSLDNRARVYDTQKDSFVFNATVDVSLWSCCWDANNPSIIYIGGQRGLVYQYDINATQACMQSFKVGDMSPVVSLCAVGSCTALPLGGVLVCKLNSCWVIDSRKEVHPLPFDGSFVSMSYDNVSEHLLVSARPSQKYANIRHTVAVLDLVNGVVTAHTLHVFQGGQHQRVMTRSNQIKFENEHFVAAFDEDYNCITLWNIQTGKKAKTINCSTPAMDLCLVQVDDNAFIASLSETTLRVYKIEYAKY